MKTGMMGWMRKTAAAIVVLGAAAAADAGVVSLGDNDFSGTGTNPDGRAISAFVDFDFYEGGFDVLLRNTSTTIAASELLVALDFELSSGTGALTLGSATAETVIQISSSTGAPTTIGTSVNLLNVGGGPTWQVISTPGGGDPSITGDYRLEWKPGTDYSIIGQPRTSGDYRKSNGQLSGSLKATNPHSPFVFDEAVYSFSQSGITASTNVTQFAFRFNTDLGTTITTQVVPLPPSAWMGLGLLGVLGVARMRRRRRSL